MDPMQAAKLAKLLKIAPELLKLCRAYTGNDNNALAEVLRRGDAAYFDDVANYVAYHESRLCRLEVQCQELQDSLVRLRDSPDDQEVRLLFNLRWEAAREATDERKEMLAAATAAMMVSRASVEDKARVERTLRQLDPIDVRVLHGIDRITGRNARERYKRWMTQERRSILQAAGCVDIDYGPLAGAGGVGVPELSVSLTGGLVVRFLRAYLRKVGPAFEDPVRGVDPTESERDAAWDRLNLLPGFPSLVATLSHNGHRSSYRHGKSTSEIVFWGVPEETRSAVAEAAQPLARDQSLGLSIAFDEQTAPGRFNTTLTGPTDLIRVLAEDLSAMWV